MAARHRSALADRPWRLLAGAGLAADDRRELLEGAGYGLQVEPAREDFPALLSRCAVSISQGGYNTVVDLLASRAPAVVVPFEADGEREQRLRAERLTEMGLLRLLPEAELVPERLAAEADAAAATGAPAPHGIDLGGAGHSTRLLRRWLLP
jgi:predicted glycosyltransferase